LFVNRVTTNRGRQRASEYAVVSTCAQISRRTFIGMAVGQAVLRAASPAGRGGTGSAEELCSRLADIDGWRTNSLAGYSVRRRYTLSHPGSQTPAETIVQLDYSYPGHKSFRVISENNCSYLEKRILHRVLNAEVQAASDHVRDRTKIAAHNYEFDLLGTDDLDGRASYVIRIIPTRRERFLVDGKIWVDSQDIAITRIEGEAIADSFWVHTFHILQRYQRVGPYWLPAFTRNDASVRILGEARLDIESFEYQLRSG
jgi:hypothetical protein